MRKVVIFVSLTILVLSACTSPNGKAPTITPTELPSTATATDLPTATETPTPLPTETVTPTVEPTLTECELLQGQPWVLGLDPSEAMLLAQNCGVEWSDDNLVSVIGPTYVFSNGFGVLIVINEKAMLPVELIPIKTIDNNSTIKDIDVVYKNNKLTFTYLDEVFEFESSNGMFVLSSREIRYNEGFQINQNN